VPTYITYLPQVAYSLPDALLQKDSQLPLPRVPGRALAGHGRLAGNKGGSGWAGMDSCASGDHTITTYATTPALRASPVAQPDHLSPLASPLQTGHGRTDCGCLLRLACCRCYTWRMHPHLPHTQLVTGIHLKLAFPMYLRLLACRLARAAARRSLSDTVRFSGKDITDIQDRTTDLARGCVVCSPYFAYSLLTCNIVGYPSLYTTTNPS